MGLFSSLADAAVGTLAGLTTEKRTRDFVEQELRDGYELGREVVGHLRHKGTVDSPYDDGDMAWIQAAISAARQLDFNPFDIETEMRNEGYRTDGIRFF